MKKVRKKLRSGVQEVAHSPVQNVNRDVQPCIHTVIHI